MNRVPRFSLTLETPAANTTDAYRHFTAKAAYETDVADVMIDCQKGNPPFVILDVRDEATYEQCHISGAIHITGRSMKKQLPIWIKTQLL